MRTVVYTAEIDDRFGAGKVSSRIGLSSPARLYNPQTSLYNDIAAEHKLKPIHCVLVDESQFLTREQVHELSEVVDTLDIPVLCYGLRTDFRGELFTGSQYLLAWSDKLVELKTICFCGRKASMVLRLDQEGRPYNEGEQVVARGDELFKAVDLILQLLGAHLIGLRALDVVPEAVLMRLGLEPRDLMLGGFDVKRLLKVFKRVAHGEQLLLIGIVFDNSHGDLLFSYCISRKSISYRRAKGKKNPPRRRIFPIFYRQRRKLPHKNKKSTHPCVVPFWSLSAR